MSKPDIKTVENDSLATVLLDLVGELATKGLLNTDTAKALLDRIVKLVEGKP